jgi:hypothetical protein
VLQLVDADLQVLASAEYAFDGDVSVPWSLARVGAERCYSVFTPAVSGAVDLETNLGTVSIRHFGAEHKQAIGCLDDTLAFTRQYAFTSNTFASLEAGLYSTSVSVRADGGLVAGANFVDELTVTDAAGAAHTVRSRCPDVITAAVVFFDADGHFERADHLCGCGDTQVASVAAVDDDVVVLLNYEGPVGLREGPLVNTSTSNALAVVRLHAVPLD